MQTVAAQWVMISLTSSALLLSAISAAGSIPVLLLAIPSGVMGDLIDRKHLILLGQVIMMIAAAALAILAAVGGLTPWVLILLLFVIGVGGAIGAPTWQTLQPELVPAQERNPAIQLGAVNQNLARAVGPAIGGVLLAATSAAFVFGINAASFVAVVGAVLVTRIPVRRSELPRERAIEATRAGGRFVANSPVLLAVIARAVAFVFFAGAIWAVLPLVAQRNLGLGSGGYGLLLGCVGVGALLAANFGPAVKRIVPARGMYALACLLIAIPALLLATVHNVELAAAVLIVAGFAWITGLGTLSAAYQGELPSWAKARAFAYYLVAFQGAMGIGALVLGAVAQADGVNTAMIVVAAGLGAAILVTWALPLPAKGAADLHMADPMPLPDEIAAGDDREPAGPVAVTVSYQLAEANIPEFLTLAKQLKRMRKRTGAIHWHLHRGLEDPNSFTELFVVGSWAEHEQQHHRMERGDQQLLNRVEALQSLGAKTAVRHSISIKP